MMSASPSLPATSRRLTIPYNVSHKRDISRTCARNMSMQMKMTKQQNINKLVLKENIEFAKNWNLQ
jgi:hypothetical protein